MEGTGISKPAKLRRYVTLVVVDMTKTLHVQSSPLNIVLEVLQNHDQNVQDFLWSYSG